MLCAFDGPPRILRLHGRAEVVMPDDARFAALVDGFDDPSLPEARRAIVLVHVTRGADACGYGVPLMTLRGHRPHHEKATAKQLRVQGGEEPYRSAARRQNERSIDGLPALPAAAGQPGRPARRVGTSRMSSNPSAPASASSSPEVSPA